MMTVTLYLGVEEVFIHRTEPVKGVRRRYAIAPYALTFLCWATYGFECRWLTRWNRDGGANRIRAAFQIALNLRNLPNDMEDLFECISPTVWDNAMVEGIDVDTDFYWIETNPDQESLAALERRGLQERLIQRSPADTPEDIAKVQLLLEPYYE